MTAPGPVPGLNPWTGSYQTKQYSTQIPPLTNSVLDALASPPASGVTAENPSNLYLENTNPPVGAGDNEPAGSFTTPVRPTNLYAQEGDDDYEGPNA